MANDECVYCGDRDSIEHSFIECMFTRLFTQKVLNWFNQVNASQISPTQRRLFGITTELPRHKNNTEIQLHRFIYVPLYLFS